MRRLARRWTWWAGLAATWVLLQGEVTLGNALGGLAASALVLVAVPVAEQPRAHEVHPLGFARFVGFVAVSLVTSSLAVVLATVTPTPARLRSGIVRCRLPGATPLVTTMVADAITLTPGTLTLTADVDGEGAVLHVHVLGLGDVDAFRAEVDDLHRRAVAAVRPLAAGGPP